jgi:hypothetical protein
MKGLLSLSVILRSEATKNLLSDRVKRISSKVEQSRSFASLRMTTKERKA